MTAYEIFVLRTEGTKILMQGETLDEAIQKVLELDDEGEPHNLPMNPGAWSLDAYSIDPDTYSINGMRPPPTEEERPMTLILLLALCVFLAFVCFLQFMTLTRYREQERERQAKTVLFTDTR